MQDSNRTLHRRFLVVVQEKQQVDFMVGKGVADRGTVLKLTF